MRLLIRIVAALAGVSVLGTLWFIAALAAGGGLGTLLRSGLLGALTIAGWVVTLVVGPVAAVQLWRFREIGRRAGIMLFGFGVVYYVVGLLVLRARDAPIAPIVAAATMFAVPLLVLLSRRTRLLFATTRSEPVPGRSRVVDVTADHVAATIENFVEGRGGAWDWDDFLSSRIADLRLEAIRQRCSGLSEEFPPQAPGHYCGGDGVEVMRAFVRELRNLPASQDAPPDGTAR